MRCHGTKIRIAKTTKNSKRGVVGHLMKEKITGNSIIDGRRWRRLRRKTAVAKASAQYTEAWLHELGGCKQYYSVYTTSARLCHFGQTYKGKMYEEKCLDYQGR